MFINVKLSHVCSITALLVLFLSSSLAMAKNDKDVQDVTLVVPGFQELLVATDKTSPGEIKQLQKATASYLAQSDVLDTSAFEKFLKDQPASAWRAAIQLNLGLVYYQNGAFSDAITAWEDAWQVGKNADGLIAKSMVDRVFGELVRMHARLGHMTELDALFAEAGDRVFIGPATAMVLGAREGLWAMRNEPGVSFLCGALALRSVYTQLNPLTPVSPILDSARSGKRGFTLKQLNQLAADAGLPYEMAYRIGDAPIPLPAVIHWKLNHYAAVLGEENGYYHVKDATFGRDLWIPRKVLDKESSGYFLIHKDSLSDGWKQVNENDAEQIYGMGNTGEKNGKRTTPCDDKKSGSTCGCNCKGMPRYDVHSMLVSLNITDTPVGYDPIVGPSVYTTLTYNHLDLGWSNTLPNFSLGPKWTMNWRAAIVDDPITLQDFSLLVAGGGVIEYSSGQVNEEYGDTITRVSTNPIRYERIFKDGRKEIYDQSDGATSGYRSIFLTKIIDAKGNAVTLNYETVSGLIRLKYVVDQNQKTTNFSYAITERPLLVTGVVDPFGRSAAIGYDESYRLSSITDAEGMVTTFTYAGASDVINSMTNPYSRVSEPNKPTLFNVGNESANMRRWIEITEPDGETERVEYTNGAVGIPSTATAEIPTGMEWVLAGYSGLRNLANCCLEYRNTFYWDKRSYKKDFVGKTLDYAYPRAARKHWLHSYNMSTTEGILESTKQPLESTLWFTYPNQWDTIRIDAVHNQKPWATGRIVGDGESQVNFTVRNNLGNIICSVDPEGKVIKYTYDTNDIDLKVVERRISGVETLRYESCNSGTYQTLESMTYYPHATYNIDHLVQTHTDALGNGTFFTYNTSGQVLTVANALGQVTTYSYTGADGTGAGNYLHQITDANNNVVATYTYYNGDVINGVYQGNNLKTRANANNYTETYLYDNLNRLKIFTYPDSTTETFTYDKLDLVAVKDRNGDMKHMTYDNVRNLTTQYTNALAPYDTNYFYENGKLRFSIDGDDGVTGYVLDDESRVVQAQRGSRKAGYSSYDFTSTPSLDDTDPKKHKTTYTYENTTSRLKSVKDALNNSTQYTYDKADRIKTVKDANNNITSYTYTDTLATGYELLIDSPDAGKTRYQYDFAGNLKTETKGYQGVDSQIIQYGYDILNRLSTIDYGNDGTIDVSYTYDESGVIAGIDHGFGKGHLTHIIDESGRTDYKYDISGNVLNRIVKPTVGPQLTTQYSYDAANQLLNTVYANGQIVTAARSTNHVTALTDTTSTSNLLSSIAYQPLGAVKNWTTNSGGTVNQYARTFDLNNRMNQWQVVGMPGLHNLGYDGYGQLSTSNNTADASKNESYGYDAVGRVQNVTAEYGNLTYGYDAVGNRQSVLAQNPNATEMYNETYTPVSGSNRLDSVTRNTGTTPGFTRSFTYDGRGNVKTDKRTQYISGVAQTPIKMDLIYDHKNRLSGVLSFLYQDMDGDGLYNDVDTDDDGDGMPDVWEMIYGLNPFLNDASGDLDGDGFTNLQEYQNGTDPTIATSKIQNDFGGDRKADVLLRNTATGDWNLAQLNGLMILNQGSVSGAFTDTDNVIVSTADFNGDGSADILTRGTVDGLLPGTFHIDLMNGANVIGSAWLTTMSTVLNNEVMSTKDFNKDGKADVLLRNKVTGVWTINYMYGTNAPTISTLNASTDICYTMKGDGDYDGNGYPDILLRKDACGGTSYPWLVYTTNGTPNILASGAANGLSMNTSWGALVTDKDFNSDGKSDVLMRALTGSVQQWLLYDMNGTGAPTSNALNLATSSVWQFAAEADFNGDGKADILLRSTGTGQWVAYLLNNATIISLPSTGTAINIQINTIWALQSIDDNNGDGKGDILLRNSSNGQWQLTFLNNDLSVQSQGTPSFTTDLSYTLQND